MENTAVMNEIEEIRTNGEMSYTQGEVDALIANAVTEAEENTAEEVSNEILNKMKEFMTTGETTTAMLRYFFPDDVVVADAGQYYFFPISENLARNTYDAEQFAAQDDGTLQYSENGEVISHKGIDVSRYQGKIDWEKVAADDVEYAFVRLGIRGYTEGEIIEDDTFQDNIEGALDNDIEAGVYFFTQATSVEEAEEEAQYVLDMIEPYNVTYPVVLDVEAVSNSKARTADLTAEERTEYAIAFCEKIKGAGYTPMIYGNLKSFMLMLDLEQLEDYDKWFACYNDDYYYPYEFKIWQYSDVGSVRGISGNVDLNISFERVE
jgi:GH25 family lysozyme M1 (1,4-beta-N-acetylmuramidase)